MNEHIHKGVFAAQRRLPESGHQYHCRPNTAHTRQSRPDFGLGFRVFLTPFELFPLRAKAVTQKRGCAARARLSERSSQPHTPRCPTHRAAERKHPQIYAPFFFLIRKTASSPCGIAWCRVSVWPGVGSVPTAWPAVGSGTVHFRVIQETPLSSGACMYRGTSLMRDCLLLGSYSRPVPGTLRWS